MKMLYPDDHLLGSRSAKTSSKLSILPGLSDRVPLTTVLTVAFNLGGCSVDAVDIALILLLVL